MFIACFALVGIALWFDALLERLRSSRAQRLIPYTVLLVLLCVAGSENANGTYLAPRGAVTAEFQSDKEFVREVEASLPPRSNIFQFPYISYCSYLNAQEKTEPYDHFRGYLHSKTLRWSFGAMHARSTDRLHVRVMALPLADRVEALISLGFTGIHLDRFGYADKKFESELASLLGVTAITSRNERFAFYSLSPFATRLEARYSSEQLEHRLAGFLRDPMAIWGAGCHAEEQTKELRWRWCASKGVITIENDTPHTLRRTLRFAARSYDAEGGNLTFSGPLFQDRIPLTQSLAKYSREIDIPPGSHRIAFACTAKPYRHPSRTLVFMFADFELTESAAGKSVVSVPWRPSGP